MYMNPKIQVMQGIDLIFTVLQLFVPINSIPNIFLHSTKVDLQLLDSQFHVGCLQWRLLSLEVVFHFFKISKVFLILLE